MPLVQYSHPQRGINESKKMPAPKVIANLNAWVKSARRVFPNMPSAYTLTDEVITVKTICLRFTCPETRDRFSLVIDRTPD